MAARAKPELLCPVESTEDSPLPAGRVELSIVASGYIDSGFAIAKHSTGDSCPSAEGEKVTSCIPKMKIERRRGLLCGVRVKWGPGIDLLRKEFGMGRFSKEESVHCYGRSREVSILIEFCEVCFA